MRPRDKITIMEITQILIAALVASQFLIAVLLVFIADKLTQKHIKLGRRKPLWSFTTEIVKKCGPATKRQTKSQKS